MSMEPLATSNDGPVLPADFVPQVASAPGTVPGHCRPLDRIVTLIGSRRDCHLSIDHAEISKVHAALIHTGRGLAVADLCSRSGTFVNDTRISATPIKPGDRVRLGPIELKLEWGSDDACGPDLALEAPLVIEYDGSRVELSALPAMIGRRSTSSIPVDTPDVSLAHAILFSYEGRPAIFDLGSRSGTIVNDARVEMCWLRDGDVLTIGGEVLELTWEGSFDDDLAVVGDDPNADTVLTGEAAEATPAEAGKPSDLRGLLTLIESNLDVLHKAVRNRVEEVVGREETVAGQQETLATEIARLASDREDLKRRAGELDERMSDVIVREKAVREQEQVTAKRSGSLDRTREKLREATAKLRRERSQIVADGEALEKRERDLREREALVARNARQADEAAAACEARRLRLDALEEELVARAAALEAKESETKAVEDRMEAFQKALAEASEVFGGPGEEGQPGRAESSPSGRPARPAAVRRPAAASGAASANSSGGSGSGRGIGLPGPVVDQPLFGSGEQGDGGEAGESGAPKRKRRWWS